MTKISIILPIYNVEKYLRRCLDSVINQTIKDIEIILATDGPDSCDKICEEYAKKDSRIKIISHPGSYGKAFNESLKIASGTYIGIVETDDWCDTKMFEKMYSKAQETNADVVKCGFYFAYDDQKQNIITTNEEYPDIINLELNSKFIAEQPSVWSCIYKKDFLINNNILMVEERMPYIDVPFHYETLCKAKKYCLLKEPLYFYYQDNPNQTVQNVQPFTGINSEKRAYNSLKNTSFFESYKEGFLFAIAQHLFWNYKRIEKDKRNAFWNAAKESLKTIDIDGFNYRYFNNDLAIFFKGLISESYYTYKIKKFAKTLLKSLFAINDIYQSEKIYKQIKILGIKFKFRNCQQEHLLSDNNESIFYNILNKLPSANPTILLNKSKFYYIMYSGDINSKEINPLKNIITQQLISFNTKSPYSDIYLLWGSKYWKEQCLCAKFAKYYKKPLLIIEDGFLKSVASPWDKKANIEYKYNLSYTINSKTVYFDAHNVSELEKLLNDKNLIISEGQKQRARKCIDKIVENHLTKYNHQPIFTPEIGRNGVKKILVIDQSYGDMDIEKAYANDETFKNMLECAIKENPNADIIVKTHPDTILGSAKGYYTGLKQYDNVYPYTEAINPISLIQYCDEVYVCSSQMGFEALMCGKKVHCFGIGFYSGYGLTDDRQKCPRRTTTRTLEEAFYIIYILFSYYVNPETNKKCEIEDIINYIIKTRTKYFGGNLA